MVSKRSALFLTRIVFIIFVVAGAALSLAGFFSSVYRTRLQDLSAILFLASIVVWGVFLLNSREWLSLFSLFFKQTRNRQSEKLDSKLFWFVTELVVGFIASVVLSRACYHYLAPSLFGNHNWYDTLINLGLVLAGIAIPALIVQYSLRRFYQNRVRE